MSGLFIMWCSFNSGKKKFAVQTAKEYVLFYDDDTIAECIVRKWFAKFKIGHFDLEYREYSSSSEVVDDDQIVTLIIIQVTWHGNIA